METESFYLYLGLSLSTILFYFLSMIRTMLSHIRIYPLLLGLVIGVIGILFIKPEQIISYTYPIPEKAKDIIYKDRNDMCYQYVPREVNCDQHESSLKPFPLSL
jgi:hypothetical protein